MAKNWYPVIDITLCTECGACVDMCTHGVFHKEKRPIPTIIFPDGCVDHCHGCGNKCPVGAIQYAGEDSNWTPPHGKKETIPECTCHCSK